ncbi:MAG: NADH-dependent alcohol dehydrogenase, partial [Chlorobium sp.]
FAAQTRPARFAQFAQRIFGLSLKHPEDRDAAMEGIDRFEAFLHAIGCPTHLSQLEIGEALLERYAEDTVKIIHDGEGRLPGRPPMSKADIIAVLRSAL